MLIDQEQYQDMTATVIGGRGELGRRMVLGFNELGFRNVAICEQGDVLRDFVQTSDVLFFAIDGDGTKDLLNSVRHLLRPSQTILDGASVKASLIPIYHELKEVGIGICSTHLGVTPTQPWRGAKVFICGVGAGPDSEAAKQLASKLYIAKNASIDIISIEQHEETVAQYQWYNMVMQHLFAATLRIAGIPLGKFNRFSTLNGELATLPLGRTLGQGAEIPLEIIFTQPRGREFFSKILGGLCELVHGLDTKEGLRDFLQANINFHNDPDGTVEEVFRKAGRVGARLANLRMYSFSFRIIDDRPGRLREVLEPFYIEMANLTAIDSMSGEITQEEKQLGVDPDKIVDFDAGIDPKTIDPEKEERIKDKLRAMGCIISS